MSHINFRIHVAHGIMESLETITSLRPRSSGKVLSIIPSPSVLRKLHKTLALESHPGWHGTLVPTRATALRDDSTVKVRASSASAVPAATATAASTSSSPAPTSVTPVASTTAPTTTPYTGYSYYPTQQPQAYRPAAGTTAQAPAYAPYKPGATSYYQNYPQQSQQYYGQQAYAGAANQQPYAAYSSWFAHAQQYAATAAANAATTGRGTPQPAVATTTPTAAYGYYQQQPAAAQQPGPTGTGVATPVANTVALNKAASGGVSVSGVWGGYALGQQPTLPARTASAAAATPITNGYQPATQQQSYYGAYQAPQQQAAQPTAR